MSSSSESEDESTMSKSSMSKKEASNSYLTLLNSNNKFSEMLKSKIQQTDSSPTLTNRFQPIASSTQIGTPVELKRKKHVKKHADVINHRDKDFRDVIVKKEKSSEDSGSERKVSKKRKLKIVTHAESESSDEVTPSKTRDEEIITSKSTKRDSESSVDSESDSDDSSDTQRIAERSTIRKRSSSEQSNSEDESGKKRKLAVMSRESFSKHSNFKIKFAKYNMDELANSKRKWKNKQISTSEIDTLPPPSHIKREVSSDAGSPDRRTKTVSKKEKRKLARKTSTSESSDTHISVTPPNGNTGEQNSSSDTSNKVENRKKTQKKTKHTNDHKASTSDSEDGASKSRLQHPKSLVTKGKSRSNDESSTSNEDERQQSKKHSNNDRSNETPSSRLRKLELDDSLTPIPNRFDSCNNIKSKRDVYIIQIPLKLDPNRLINKSISLDGQIRINKNYDSVASYEPHEPITICTNIESANVKIIQPVGSITLQRRLESTEIPDVPDVLDKSVAFPTNLKSRHPLFGSNFDNKIKLEEHVKMKLQSVRDSPVKKKKKKKEKRHRMEETEHQEEEIFKFLSQGNEESERVEKKKKKKRENRECEERHEASGSKKRRREEVEEEVPKKKKKYDEDSGESLIQEMLLSRMATLDMKKKKKKKKES